MNQRFAKLGRHFISKGAISFAFVGLLFSSGVSASVDIKNGNMIMSYVDLFYTGGFEPIIRRVYNSKSNQNKGSFGWGWGYEYETYLSAFPDGTLVVHEFGSGADNRFTPPNFSDSQIAESVRAISTIASKSGLIAGGPVLEDYKRKLKNSSSFRDLEWQKLRKKYPKLALAELKPIAEGAQFQSLEFSYQYITKKGSEFIRKHDTGKTQVFYDFSEANDSVGGRLKKVYDKNGNFIEFKYKDGNLEKLVDNFNRKIFFTFNNKGLISKLEGENGKATSYTYNDSAELTLSKDASANIYAYEYDKQKRHNLEKISYRDKSTYKVDYYGRDKFENVKRVTDRTGTVTDYDYPKLPDGVAAIIKTLSSGKVISTEQYEYHEKTKPSGDKWTSKLVAIVDKDRTDTDYDEKCLLPEKITRGKQFTSFTYDLKCRVVKKVTQNDITTLAYHPTAGKVSQVAKSLTGPKPKDLGWSKFDYDAKANLIFAENSERKKVTLAYDANGRIKTMLDQDKRQISFEYNEDSKPIKITDPSLGSISVEYDNKGEIKKVDSPAGRKIAVQVTTAFQNLLDIIRPAGVTLSF